MKNNIIAIIVTWFGSGKAGFAPGTCGSLATLPVVFGIEYFWGQNGIIIFAIAVTLIGIYAADAYAKHLGIEDPGMIVIDETAGQSITLIFAGLNIYLYLIGFVLFRIFDILKPWPVSWADTKVKGGLGIMLDDIFAGLIGMVILWAIKTYLF